MLETIVTAIMLLTLTVLVIVAAIRRFNIIEAKAKIKEELMNTYTPQYPKGENHDAKQTDENEAKEED